MPNSRITRIVAEEAVLAVEKKLKAGFRPKGMSGKGIGSMSASAKELGIPASTMQSRIRRAESEFGLMVNWGVYKPSPIKVKEPEEEVIEVSEKQRLNDTIADQQAEIRDLSRRINHQDDIERMAMGLKDYPLNIPTWTHKPKTYGKGRFMEAPVLFTSDFQFGEVVDLDDMEGINEYNVEIAVRRYNTLIDKTVDLCFNHTANPEFPGIIYLRGGDAISGGIHDELAETDEYTPPEAVVALARHEIAGIEHLADRFDRVHVISVPGNHDRTTMKKRHKKMVAGSYELMVQAMMQIHFEAKNDSRVSFHTPRSGDAYFPVWGWQFLLTHGDRIGTGGGTGYIGPIATITRGFAKIKQQHSALGKMLHFILTGHFHTSCEPPGGFGNGSLVGPSEYARDLRAVLEAPNQWLLMVHPEQGVTQRRKIYVEPPKFDMDAATTWTAVPGRA